MYSAKVALVYRPSALVLLVVLQLVAGADADAAADDGLVVIESSCESDATKKTPPTKDDDDAGATPSFGLKLSNIIIFFFVGEFDDSETEDDE